MQVIWRRSGAGWLLALAGLCAVALAVPGSASAAAVTCSGTANIDRHLDQPNGVGYSFSCNEDIIDFTIASSKQVDYFNPAPVVFDGTTGEPSATDAFSCEGGFPSHGFGCNGKATAGNVPTGDFSTSTNPCGTKPSKKAHFWVVAVAQELVDTGTTQTLVTKSSEPFRLPGLTCRYRPTGRHHHHHGGGLR